MSVDVPAPTPVLPDPICCSTMAWHMNHHCDEHGADCPDRVVKWGAFTERWGFRAENAFYDLTFCPWCGTPVQEPFTDEAEEEEEHDHERWLANGQRVLG